MISRFAKLFDTTATLDPIAWSDLFDEFSRPVVFRGDDHQGWSGAEFDPPLRSIANVKRIHVLALDVDEGMTLDDAEKLFADYFGLIHTTRSHTGARHRFRIILPLARSVSPFEYSAIWYRVNAFASGKIDQATKDASRFWFVPGIGDHDGACFEARRLGGALLDPDEWLTKPDPTLSGQPLNGATPINASVRETRARAYLSKMPEAVQGQHGSTALFSAARKLIQDFDLDDDATFRLLASEYNPRCRPPWSEKEIRRKVQQARDKARHRNPVEPDRERSSTSRKTYSTPYNPTPEQVAADREEHEEPPARASGDDSLDAAPAADPESPTTDWRIALRYTQKGVLTKDPGNAALFLRCHDSWRGCFEYNAFSDQVHWSRRAPDIGFKRPEIGERLQDHHGTLVHHWFAKVEGVSFTKSAIWEAIMEAAHDNAIHPVREYLTGLAWDGKPRLSRWLVTYLGATASDYAHAIGRWWPISAVARAMLPGCQADHMLILEGPQGAGKSTALSILGGDWYLGSLPDVRERNKAAEVLQGNWIVEIGELDAFRGAAATRVKDFLTQRFDEFRAAYARFPSRHMRGCVFAGTTNEMAYLQDPSGARRFWPVLVRSLDREALQRDRDQLWAEARIAYEAGESWWPGDQFAGDLAEQQEQRYEEDEWSPRIAAWIRGGELTPARDGFTVGDVMAGALGIEAGKWDRGAQTRVGVCLRRLGLRCRLETDGKARVRRYYAARDDQPAQPRTVTDQPG